MMSHQVKLQRIIGHHQARSLPYLEMSERMTVQFIDTGALSHLGHTHLVGRSAVQFCWRD